MSCLVAEFAQLGLPCTCPDTSDPKEFHTEENFLNEAIDAAGQAIVVLGVLRGVMRP